MSRGRRPSSRSASALYGPLAARFGERLRATQPASLFRKFVEASPAIGTSDNQVVVASGRRAHSPCLIEAGYSDSTTSIPWLHNRPLKINFAGPPVVTCRSSRGNSG